MYIMIFAFLHNINRLIAVSLVGSLEDR